MKDNKNALRQASWNKMNTLLDQEMPVQKPVTAPSKRAGVLLILLLFVLAVAGAYIFGRKYSDLQASYETEIKYKDMRISSLSFAMTELEQDIARLTHSEGMSSTSAYEGASAQRLSRVHETRGAQMPKPHRQSAATEGLWMPFYVGITAKDAPIEFSDFDYSAYHQSNPAPRSNSISNSLTSLPSIDDQLIETETIEPSISIRSDIAAAKKKKRLLSSWAPTMYATAGATFIAPRKSENKGFEAELGVHFFPENRWDLQLYSGVMNQKTEIINQATAAHAGFEVGLPPRAIEEEVKEEQESKANYTFANLGIGTSYKLSPKIKILSSLKASYILDRPNFSEASIPQNATTERRVSSTLDDLVDNNQVHRWGFSGVIGAEYAVSDRIGIQLSYNKYITPLVSPLPFSASEDRLSDFAKVGVRMSL